MSLDGINVGMGICGSFCTLKTVIKEMQILRDMGINLYPVLSYNVQNTDTRFGQACELIKQISEISRREPITSIRDAEPLGPRNFLDAFVIAPCTGNTLAKFNCGITDTPVLMAAKAHIRNNKPLIISVATNDALGTNFANIGQLMNKKNIYFVPFEQDDPVKKPKSLVADFSLIPETIEKSLEGLQVQPVIRSKKIF